MFCLHLYVKYTTKRPIYVKIHDIFTIIVNRFNLNRSIFIFLLFCGILLSNDFMAQSGGRRREHRNQKRASGGMFKGKKSAGNADNFARGGGRRGGGGNKAWAMRHSRPGSYKSSDSRTLFSRYRTKGKVYRHNILAKQNADRARKRVRGNKVFHRKKFF